MSDSVLYNSLAASPTLFSRLSPVPSLSGLDRPGRVVGSALSTAAAIGPRHRPLPPCCQLGQHEVYAAAEVRTRRCRGRWAARGSISSTRSNIQGRRRRHRRRTERSRGRGCLATRRRSRRSGSLSQYRRRRRSPPPPPVPPTTLMDTRPSKVFASNTPPSS